MFLEQMWKIMQDTMITSVYILLHRKADQSKIYVMLSIPSCYLFFGLSWQLHLRYDFPASFLQFRCSNKLYSFDFISWRNLLVEFYGNGTRVDAIFRQSEPKVQGTWFAYNYVKHTFYNSRQRVILRCIHLSG